MATTVARRIAASLFSLALLSVPAHALTDPVPVGSITLKPTTAAVINVGTDGTPQDLTFAPDGSNRIFIATRDGNIRILNSGVLSSTPFLNMGAAGLNLFNNNEGGFLGLAFSPNYATDGKFYTFQSEPFSTSGPAADYSPPEMFPTTSTHPTNQNTIREWTVNPGNPNAANTTSRVLVRLNQPQGNHQGGSIRFGLDGNLYFATGDGGGGNDFDDSPNDNNDGHNNTLGNGQDTSSWFGKVLRINPDPAAAGADPTHFTLSANGQYSIPIDNPFITGPAGSVKEIYAYGLRNPYKFDFDSVTGKLYLSDVGQGSREEVDVILNGGNYGWPFREGTRDNTANAGRSLPAGFSSIAPIAEYTHDDGIATIGAALYRGGGMPALYGDYVFGDLGTTTGRLFYTNPADGNVFEFQYDPSGVPITSDLYGISTGPQGELYAFFSNGNILQLTPVPEPATIVFVGIPLLLLLRRRPGKSCPDHR